MKNPHTSYENLVRFTEAVARLPLWDEMTHDEIKGISFDDHKAWGDGMIKDARRLTREAYSRASTTAQPNPQE